MEKEQIKQIIKETIGEMFKSGDLVINISLSDNYFEKEIKAEISIILDGKEVSVSKDYTNISFIKE